MSLFLVGVIIAFIIAKLFGTWALGALVGGLQGAIGAVLCFFIGCLIAPDVIMNFEAFRYFVSGGAILGALTGAASAA